jgi:hypothetical protein
MANRRVSLKGKGADLFFSDYAPEAASPAPEPVTATPAADVPETPAAPIADADGQAPAAVPPPQPMRIRAINDTVVPRNQDTTIEEIRKAVRLPGKEAATYRITQEEKNLVRDIIYTYRRQGVRTSEIEIGRIALNYIFADYTENGDNSILARVLAALHS